jgi:hypothetical protein
MTTREGGKEATEIGIGIGTMTVRDVVNRIDIVVQMSVSHGALVKMNDMTDCRVARDHVLPDTVGLERRARSVMTDLRSALSEIANVAADRLGLGHHHHAMQCSPKLKTQVTHRLVPNLLRAVVARKPLK